MLSRTASNLYWMARYVERMENTARILDVKYHMLLPAQEQVGGPLDYFQWAAILRSVSALTSYHWVYRENVKPWLSVEEINIFKINDDDDDDDSVTSLPSKYVPWESSEFHHC